MIKTILSLCDYTGNWSRPYSDNGYTVIKVDLKLGEDAILWPSKPSLIARLSKDFANIQDYCPIYGILAAPVCTAFAGSGAKHPRTDKEIKDGLALVDACFRLAYILNPVFFCLENPVGKLQKWIGPPKFRFNPCDFGDDYTKKTCLWGHFNIPIKNPVIPTKGSKLWKNYGGKSERTKEARSATPMGFANAFYEVNQ